jgi:hypothetical protein
VTVIAARKRETLDTVVGLMAAAAIFVSVLGMINVDLSLGGVSFEARPIRVGVGAVLLALVAAGIGGRHQRLATAAVFITAACWMFGMIIAVVTGHPLY